MSEYRKAEVRVQNIRAGTLEETDAGYRFSYDVDYLRSEKPLPVSLTLPLSEESYEQPVLFSFFDGLIPEGWLLDVACHNWKIEREDRFGLLLTVCRDCIGDVGVIAEEV